MIEPLPGLRMYGGRHILSQSRQWNQEHIMREYANFMTSKGYIWSPGFSVSHLICSLIKWKLSIWFLLWVLLFYLGQSLVSSEALRTLLSKTLSQISSETLTISINLNRFLIMRLLITQQINVGITHCLCSFSFTYVSEAAYTLTLRGWWWWLMGITGNSQE